MSHKLILGIVLGTLAFACVLIFLTPHSGVGAVIVLVTVLELAYLIAVARKSTSATMFWSGLAGLMWMTFFVGFAWDIPAERRVAGARSNSSPIAEAYALFFDWVYVPITRPGGTSGPTMSQSAKAASFGEVKGVVVEFRSVLDTDIKNFKERLVPSIANFSRLVAAISAWLVVGCTAAVVSRRTK